jgi:hypothetical protein
MLTAMDGNRTQDYHAAAYKSEQQECIGHVQVCYSTHTKVFMYVQMEYC